MLSPQPNLASLTEEQMHDYFVRAALYADIFMIIGCNNFEKKRPRYPSL